MTQTADILRKGHTPGPWLMETNEKSGTAEILGKRGDGNVRLSDGMGRITTVDCATLETGDRIQFPDVDPEALSNARLIAAAPELLEALQAIIDMNVQYAIDKYGDASKAETMACVTTAREAIAKAQGGEA